MFQRSCSIFVGNIPFGATEEQLIEMFKEVGPVKSFRLVFDRETGKPKGYGFCEYHDTETALSAIRNLNKTEILGRELRLDMAESELHNEWRPDSGQGKSARDDLNGPSGPLQQAGSQGPMMGMPPGGPPHPQTTRLFGIPPSQPTGVSQPPSGMPASMHGPSLSGPPSSSHGAPSSEMVGLEAITSVLSALSPTQLFELMSQMKLLVQNHPDQARQLLSTNPQLTYALLQAQLMLGMVDASVTQQLLQKAHQNTLMRTPLLPSPGISGEPSVEMQPPPTPMPMPSGISPPQGPPGMFMNSLPPQQPMPPGGFHGRPLGPPGGMIPSHMMSGSGIGFPPGPPHPPPGPLNVMPPGHYLPYGTPVLRGMMPGMNMPPPHHRPPMGAPFEQLPDHQQSVIMRLMSLTPQEMDALPHDQRQQVMQLKSQLAQAGITRMPTAPPASVRGRP